MDASQSNRIGPWRRLWRSLDATRRVVLNIVFFGLLVALVAMASGGKPKVPKGCALVVKPTGTIVEQLEGNALDRVRAELVGGSSEQTLLKDLVDAIDAAREDQRIKTLVLDLAEMGSAGMTKLEDLKAALGRFRASQKKIIATADSYDQYSYYLAACADEVWLNPQGLVLLEGFSRFGMFYKDGLDRLGVDWHVFRVGEYKSAVEPYLRNDMSPEAKEANLAYLNDLWASYLADVAAARATTPEKITDYIERFGEHLKAAGGNGAAAALAAGLVDKVEPRDVLRKRVIELAGEDPKTHTFKQVGHEKYLEALGSDRFGRKAKGDLVAVVVAKGTISDGSRPPGQIGGDSTAALIRQARNDENVKAIVLRVDSPGGSGFASEVIRRELEVARAEGKVVVASMGSVAASGGYWISMASDEVWASPNTITGSIGIFGMFPTFDRPLQRYLGVRVDGVGTTRYAGALRPDRPLDPAVGEAIQTLIDGGYRQFLDVVAKGRGMTPEAVDKVARGRVWSGQDALGLGLVDKLGSLDDAIKAAAKRAGLSDAYKVRYIEKEMTWKERLVRSLLTRAAAAAGEQTRTSRAAAPYLAVARMVARQELELAALAQETPVLAYAFVPTE
ncbi:MAG TPA: signal peptide peptidase SppA [Thermoanaerobaculaceae bacterium]|nr:signal peptide peptidase SppA [Thermoanaerobaculaceae bacterium]HRS17689.1 signal peptide peptidase SppA [Thermoanaerobaculaceae bacterium]